MKVPTGAFVARRNGKVFVTGNSGFPKSLDVSKALDKAAGAERAPRTGTDNAERGSMAGSMNNRCSTCDKAFFSANPCECPRADKIAITDAARRWNGWGTALKPAWEPIILARKPLIGTVAANVLKHGTGGINIDGCRIESDGSHHRPFQPSNNARNVFGAQRGYQPVNAAGRWPANVILDEEAAALLDEQTGVLHTHAGTLQSNAVKGSYTTERQRGTVLSAGDSGGASRFFYTAKASRSERTHGGTVENKHPTVKPISLMRYLVRLVTPPGGSVLDPFCGSGSTLVAAELEGFDYLGIEQDPESHKTACERLANVEVLRKKTDPKTMQTAEEEP